MHRMNDHIDCNSDDDATDYNLSSFGDELQFDNDVDRQSSMEDAEYYCPADDPLLNKFEEASNFPPKITDYMPVDMFSLPVVTVDKAWKDIYNQY